MELGMQEALLAKPQAGVFIARLLTRSWVSE